MNTRTAPQVFLTDLRESDAETLYQWRNDPAIRHGALSYPFYSSLAAETEWIRSFAPKGTPSDLCMAVRERHDGGLLGYVQLRSIDWVSRCAEFGIVIGVKSQREKGFGYAALDATIRYALHELGLRRLWLRVPADNDKAIRLYLNAGFKEEGKLCRHVFRNGGYMDVFVFGFEPASPSLTP